MADGLRMMSKKVIQILEDGIGVAVWLAVEEMGRKGETAGLRENGCRKDFRASEGRKEHTWTAYKVPSWPTEFVQGKGSSTRREKNLSELISKSKISFPRQYDTLVKRIVVLQTT